MRALTFALILFTAQTTAWEVFSITPTGKIRPPRSNDISHGRLQSNSISLKSLIAIATGMPPSRIEGPASIDTDHYAVTAILSDEWRLRLRTRAAADALIAQDFRALLEKELITRFHLEYRFNTRDQLSYTLQPVEGLKLKARQSPSQEPGRIARSGTPFINVETTIEAKDVTFQAFCNWLQNDLKAPVQPDPALPDGAWTFRLKWQTANQTPLSNALKNQLGLELIEAPRTQTWLIVDRAESLSPAQ